MIEIKNLSKSFQDKTVLKDICLEIKEGDILGIVGHSGAGKSTLLRCLNGLETYESGTLKVMGNEVKSLSGVDLRNLRKNMGMIFQGFNLLNSRNVYDNIAFPMEVWKCEKNLIDEKVKKLISIVHLEHKLYSPVSSLSGGEKQRVAIARALSMDPKILLCDEATSALDPKTRKSILKLLKEINEKLNITIVLVTHEMEVVKELCNKVALIDKGEIISYGDVEKLFLCPNKQVTEFLDEDLEALPNSGVNIKIYFGEGANKDHIITSMARELDLDFSIAFGKLEQFREKVLGNLVINIKNEDEEKIINYLYSKSILYEVI